MRTVPLISSDLQLIESVRKCVAKSDKEIFFECMNSSEEAYQYLSLEIPELVVINFSDSAFNGFDFLHRIVEDVWLLHAGIIALCKNHDEIRRIEEIKEANLIIAFTYDEISMHLPKILSLINKNRRVLFQRGIGSDLIHNLSGSFELENNPYEGKCLVNLICNFLFNSSIINPWKRFEVKLALTEMVMNAIEHGNCSITSQEKTAWLESNYTIYDLIQIKLQDPCVREKKIIFEYSLTPSKGHFFIADQGSGFDWRKWQKEIDPSGTPLLHGRGILLTRNIADKLTYNDAGNEVTIEFDFTDSSSQLRPGIFEHIPVREIKKGEVIFSEGEESNFLYYIAKGQFNVFVKGKQVSALLPDDIFMGEMSFLLNNYRNATVVAASEGKLIEVSKRDFIEAIKSKPHYALFLCRLLAARIDRSNNYAK